MRHVEPVEPRHEERGRASTGEHSSGSNIMRHLTAALIVMGVMLFTGELTQLNIKAQNWLDDLGLNFFKSV